MTENFAIRTLETIVDIYAKLLLGNPAAPHHVNQVPRDQWSIAAVQLIEMNPTLKPKDFLRVEHGTPRRGFARMALDLHDRQALTEENMTAVVKRYWKLAVITLEEDERLGRLARSTVYASPDERWKAASIQFAAATLKLSN